MNAYLLFDVLAITVPAAIISGSAWLILFLIGLLV